MVRKFESFHRDAEGDKFSNLRTNGSLTIYLVQPAPLGYKPDNLPGYRQSRRKVRTLPSCPSNPPLPQHPGDRFDLRIHHSHVATPDTAHLQLLPQPLLVCDPPIRLETGTASAGHHRHQRCHIYHHNLGAYAQSRGCFPDADVQAQDTRCTSLEAPHQRPSLEGKAICQTHFRQSRSRKGWSQ